MTKGGISKPKTLGRLLFGEKRKQHASPSRHRSSTRNGDSNRDASPSGMVSPPVPRKMSINLHDWAVWRMQFNEQMANFMGERRSDLRSLRQYLQSNSFYQQYSRDANTGRYVGVRLLFSIPRAKFRDEYLEGFRTNYNKIINPELSEMPLYEQNNVQSHSDDRTTASVNSISAVPPILIDKTITQYLPRGLMNNTVGFLQTNEPNSCAEISRSRPSMRYSYRSSDPIHSTLQKAVKDGNVLEKIKAFEMQAAAAAQADSVNKLNATSSGLNHRNSCLGGSIPLNDRRIRSPGIMHSLSPTIKRAVHQQSMRLNRGRYVYPSEHHRSDTQLVSKKKNGQPIEAAMGDVILKHRTSSQRTINDEDYSITAISSMALSSSRDHRRASASRSRHRPEISYDKRSSSKAEIHSHHRQKRTTTPKNKSTTKHRPIIGRQEASIEPPSISVSLPKEEIPIMKSNKKKNTAKIKTKKENISTKSDNNRVYGVPNNNEHESKKIETEKFNDDEHERNKMSTNDELSRNQEHYTEITHPSKLLSSDGEVPSKIGEEIPFSEPTGGEQSESNDDEQQENEGEEDNVFIEDKPVIQSKSRLPRHQSFVNASRPEECRTMKQPATLLRRHASQCSTDEYSNGRLFQRCKENSETFRKTQSPITILTRKNKVSQEDPMVYDTPVVDQSQSSVSNMQTMKKKRTGQATASVGQTNNKQISKQILHAIMNSMNNIQEPVGTMPSSANDDFFENGPLTNPEDTMTRIIDSS